jgi:hypothetical protein
VIHDYKCFTLFEDKTHLFTNSARSISATVLVHSKMRLRGCLNDMSRIESEF